MQGPEKMSRAGSVWGEILYFNAAAFDMNKCLMNSTKTVVEY